MKLAFSIFVLILTASISHAMELRFVALSKVGCKLYLPIAYSADDVTWYGRCSGGFAEGEGELRLSKDAAGTCTAKIEKGKIIGRVDCKAGNGYYMLKFVEGVPLYAWYIDGNDTTIVEINDRGLLTNHEISIDKAQEFARKNSPHPNEDKSGHESDSSGSSSGVDEGSVQSGKIQGSADKTSESEQDGEWKTDWLKVGKECPTDITTWTNVAGDAPLVPEAHGFSVSDFFVAREGQSAGFGYGYYYTFIFPKLSIPTPIRNIETIKKLTSTDWLTLKAKMGGTPAFSEVPYRQQLANRRNYEAMMGLVDCYLNQASIREKKFSRKPIKIESSKKGDSPKDGNNQEPPVQEDFRAPLVDRKCVDFIQRDPKGVSDAFKYIRNRCGFPISVIFCMFENFKENQTCGDLKISGRGWGLEGPIDSGYDKMTADVVRGSWRVKYYICDMRDPKKMCLAPRDPERNIPDSAVPVYDLPK